MIKRSPCTCRATGRHHLLVLLLLQGGHVLFEPLLQSKILCLKRILFYLRLNNEGIKCYFFCTKKGFQLKIFYFELI